MGNCRALKESQKYILQLEKRVAELKNETEQYDKRRRAAMGKVEEHRSKYDRIKEWVYDKHQVEVEVYNDTIMTCSKVSND